MRSWKNICCPIDFSASSRKALVHAAELTREARGQLVLVHVHEGASAKLRRVLGVSSREVYDEEIAEAKESLAREVERADAIAPGRVSAQLAGGDAAESILHYLRNHCCDLLVVARHGGAMRSRRKTLGRVAEKIVKSAPCTVIVVRPDALFAVG